jgi:hypothetical protein
MNTLAGTHAPATPADMREFVLWLQRTTNRAKLPG